MRRLRIVFLTTDKREPERDYSNPLPGFGAAPAALLEGFSFFPEVEVFIISCSQKILRSPFYFAENIKYYNLQVPKLGWLKTGYLGCILATRKLIGSLKPDLVHGQGTERDCAISAIFSGFPNVITIHGNMAELARLFHARIFSFYWLSARIENFVLPRTNGVFCNSLYTEALVKPRNSRTWLVPNPLGLAFFQVGNCSGRQVIPLVFLVVGVISPRKRQQELLQFFQHLRTAGLSFKVRWIGHCPKSSYGNFFLENLKQPEYSDWNFYVGPLDQISLIAEYDAASALVHFPFEESFGLVVAEALARGLKVFSSCTGGLQEICSGPTGATLISPESWSGLRESIMEWVRQGAPLSNEAQKVMQERYHPAVIAGQHLRIYREVIASR